jgi:hypothetical protein
MLPLTHILAAAQKGRTSPGETLALLWLNLDQNGIEATRTALATLGHGLCALFVQVGQHLTLESRLYVSQGGVPSPHTLTPASYQVLQTLLKDPTFTAA